MSYFVTGATGFVGRYLVSKLLQRKGTAASNKIYVLLRKNSQKKFDAIASKMGWDMKRVLVVHGDMTSARCGVSAAQLKALKKENAELKRANEILKAAASFFAAELDRPHTRS